MHVERSGRFRLSLAPDAALPLFTAEGERAWVAGWEPEALHAPDGSLAAAGAAFRTTVGGEETLWLVLAYDPAARRAVYARMTPGSRLGTVEVHCRGDDDGGTEVEVTYRLTSLSPAGDALLAGWDEAAYADMLAEWRRQIETTLRSAAEPQGGLP